MKEFYTFMFNVIIFFHEKMNIPFIYNNILANQINKPNFPHINNHRWCLYTLYLIENTFKQVRSRKPLLFFLFGFTEAEFVHCNRHQQKRIRIFFAATYFFSIRGVLSILVSLKPKQPLGIVTQRCQFLLGIWMKYENI